MKKATIPKAPVHHKVILSVDISEALERVTKDLKITQFEALRRGLSLLEHEIDKLKKKGMKGKPKVIIK